MINMKPSIVLMGLLIQAFIAVLPIHAQIQGRLSLDSCYAMSRRNYPLVQRFNLLEQSQAYSLDNAAKGKLPQLIVSGQATYQSDVTGLPISLPTLEVESLSKDQYKLYGEVIQPITDLFSIKDRQNLIQAQSSADKQGLEVELYKLRDRVHQLYFGILLVDAQLGQVALLKKDIVAGQEKTRAAIENGIAFRSNLDVLDAEMLKADQRVLELRSTRKAYIHMLSIFIKKDLDPNISLDYPPNLTLAPTIRRPELLMFDAQKTTFDLQSKLIDVQNRPRFYLFLQTGIGRPALNFLNNDFAGYYIGGLRLNWNLSGFYSAKNDKQLLKLGQNTLDVQKETFLHNTQLTLAQQSAEVEKLSSLIESDEEIISLRERVKNTAKVQLENGTLSAIDYLSYVNAEDQARQNKILHNIQYLMASYAYRSTAGN